MAKKRSKPNWPHSRTVKMTAHANGQWVKKINGKLQYFGPWADPDGALDRYIENASDLHAGRDVPTSPSDAVTVADIFNAYLDHRRGDIDTGRRQDRSENDRAMGPAMFRKYVRAGEIVRDVVGRNRLAEKMRPRDFTRVKDHLRANFSSGTVTGYVTAIKTVFNWAADIELINAVSFGADFRGTQSKKIVRRKRREGQKKILEAATIRKLMDVANPHVKAMLLLGINAGFYAVDCSDLLISDINFKEGTVHMERHKTEVDRIFTMWPETIAAIEQTIANRPEPQDPAHGDHVFITQRGKLWVKTQAINYSDDGAMKSVTHNDYIGQEFRKLFEKAKIERPVGCGFSWLRHTFYTVARRTRDYDAANAIMGHAGDGMVEHYLEEHFIDNIRAVTDYTRNWLFEDAPAVIGKVG